MAIPTAFRDMVVVDADTHLTEPHNLWTSRAPAKFRDRVPRVVDDKGYRTWVVEDIPLARAGASGVVAADGRKVPGTAFFGWSIDDVHPGAHSVPERLAMMDDQGVWAQVVYPNTIGFGGQGLAKVVDQALRLLTATLYNDAMAAIQDQSGGRLLPMAILPWWDRTAALREVERAHRLGLRGINTTSAPHQHGLPDLGERYWDPLWEVCSDLAMPVNFHIGAAESDMDWFGKVSWPSLSMDQKLGLGSAMLYLNNAAVLGNLIYSGVLERFPRLQIVSVESAVGWIPFILRALKYQVGEMSVGAMDHLSMSPLDYFRRQIHACFWFEKEGLDEVIASIGYEHLMFETDFPHPTCTYPAGLDLAAEALVNVSDPAIRRDIIGGNAGRLYRINPPRGVATSWS